MKEYFVKVDVKETPIESDWYFIFTHDVDGSDFYSVEESRWLNSNPTHYLKPVTIDEVEKERWISVKERLPDDENEVLVHTDEDDQSPAFWLIAYYVKEINQWYDNMDREWPSALITNWRPLPIPPTTK